MFKEPSVGNETLVEKLSAQGYRPAQAAKYLAEGNYSRAVQICKEHLAEEPQSISGRLIYASALYHAGQTGSASEQFYQVLLLDPDNLVALKYLGDVKFAEGDEVAAMANYSRILEIDPYCEGLKSDLKDVKKVTTRTITLSRQAESPAITQASVGRRIPFYTETIGDLYLAQGHPRLAAEVFRTLSERNHNPRLAEKLTEAERRMKSSVPSKEKEDNNVY